MTKTYSTKKDQIKKGWKLIDAEGVVLGRLAAYVASLLQGKHKPTYERHLDCGDNVVIINANSVVLTGKKETNKIYYRHTGYPGGIKQTTPGHLRVQGRGRDIVFMAVKRMLPRRRSSLTDQRLSNLYIYGDANHQQEAQKPEVIDFKQRNKKNAGRS